MNKKRINREPPGVRIYFDWHEAIERFFGGDNEKQGIFIRAVMDYAIGKRDDLSFPDDMQMREACNMTSVRRCLSGKDGFIKLAKAKRQ